MKEANPRAREIKAGELRALLAELDYDASVRLMVQLPKDFDHKKVNPYSGKVHDTILVMPTVSPYFPEDAASYDRKRRYVKGEDEPRTFNYEIHLSARMGWDNDLEVSECHVNNEEELDALRAAS